MQVSSIRGYAVFVGLDVGKTVHHATALDVAGTRVHDAVMPNGEARLRALFATLSVATNPAAAADLPPTPTSLTMDPFNSRTFRAQHSTLLRAAG